MTDHTFDEIIKSIDNFDNMVVKLENDIVMTEEKIKQINKDDRSLLKKMRGDLLTMQTYLNNFVSDFGIKFATNCVKYMYDLESHKVDGILNDTLCIKIKQLFILVANKHRMSARYLKLPKSWLCLGFLGGVLEDLVVVMRTASQLKISSNHLITLDELIAGYKTSDVDHRFLFLAKLFSLPQEKISELLLTAINSQGKAKRISFYNDGIITYYYAIQGLLGGVKFDDRVVKTLTCDDSFNDYAVHFTKIDIALNIWNNLPTNGSSRIRKNGLPIVVGAICKFDRPIHALTNIKYYEETNKCHIISSDKDIRDRMTHGIKDVDVRPKYEAGLVFNVRKLVNDFPGSVQINEIGTLLVHVDILHEYVVKCIHSDEDVEYFWSSL